MGGEVCSAGAAGSDDLLLQFWVHTSFVPEDGKLRLEKQELDKACSDRRHQIFPASLAVEVDFGERDTRHASRRKAVVAED